MTENTKIQWADHTFNPWVGCTEISKGCDNCYTRTLMQNRLKFVEWGQGNPRRKTSEAAWKKPLQWNKRAEKTGVREKVFCASLADVFDAEVPDEWRDELFDLIRATPYLDWLLLTKRIPQPSRYIRRKAEQENPNLPYMEQEEEAAWAKYWPQNAWLGVSIEDRQALQRIYHAHPQHWEEAYKPIKTTFLTSWRVPIRFASVEPLIEELTQEDCITIAHLFDWVIVGGESGKTPRPMNLDWARRLQNFCKIHNTAFFFKQVSAKKPTDEMIPHDLLVREFPKPIHRSKA